MIQNVVHSKRNKKERLAEKQQNDVAKKVLLGILDSLWFQLD